MISIEILKRFINDVSVKDDNFEEIGKAFSEIGDAFGIAEVNATFVAPVTYCAKQDKSKEVILFKKQGKCHAVPAYCEEYITRENGKVFLNVYRLVDLPTFSVEEMAELKPILDIIFMHCEKWKMINLIRQIGEMDSLTGLPNSGGFLSYIDEQLKNGALLQYNTYYFNLTRFGLINKRFGVKETDRIISRYASIVLEFLQEGERLARLGGDNFVALVRKERNDAFLELISGVTTYGTYDGKEEAITIGAVTGILEIDDSITDCGTVLNDCTMAMNIAKHVKKTPFAYASKELKEMILRRNEMIAGFPDAIQNRELQAFYQPKVSINDYVIVGAEALVRWKKDSGFVSPGEFIPAFEQNGMVCELDFYILEQVCMDISRWLKEGIEPVRISVNFSRKHLTNHNLAEDIMQVLRKYNVDSKYIEIELTETVDEEEAGLLIDFMNKMRKYNILMTIDDFGTGYSSLNMLRSFPVDVLKIDKSLVSSMEESAQIILSNVVRMASELKMDVVAEGVETWEQVEYLKTVKCSVVQGFLFDRPMPKEQFEEKLKQKKYAIG